MYNKDIICNHCEAEFYVESEGEVLFCVECGESLPQGEWNEYRDEVYMEEEDEQD